MWLYGPLTPGGAQQLAVAGPNNYTLTCQPGSFTVSGVSASLYRNRNLTASAGSYTFTGVNAILKKGFVLTATAGSYSLSGVSAGISRNRKLTASTGSYSETGVNATLSRSKLIVATTGSYTLTGVNATITYTPSAVNYTLTAQTGAFSLSGVSSGISRGRVLTAQTGTYTFAGVSAVLKLGKVLTATAGAYTFDGKQAVLTKSGTAANYTLTCQSGSYSFGDYWNEGYTDPGYVGSATITVGQQRFSAEVELLPKRYWYVKKKRQIVVFDTAEEADAYIEAEQRAEEAIQTAQKTSRRARKRLRERVLRVADVTPAQTIQIDWLASLVEQYGMPVDLPQLIARRDLEEVVRIAMLAQEMQDEEDIETLLLMG